MINLYNFMDGIDGLASVEAITATLSMAFLYGLMGFDNLIWAPLMLAASVSGFLFLTALLLEYSWGTLGAALSD